jgi:hypothetical protein
MAQDFIATGGANIAAGFQTIEGPFGWGVLVEGEDGGVSGECVGQGPGVAGQGGGTAAGVSGTGGNLGGGGPGPGVTGQGGGVGPNGIGVGGPGVIGTGGGGNSDGVQGHGTGAYSGVAGWADPYSGPGTGVVGFGGSETNIDTGVTLGGPGVRGIGGGANTAWNNTSPPSGNAVGVFGQAGAGNSDGVYGIGSGTFTGVVGVGDFSQKADQAGANGTGVIGFGGAPSGPGIRGIGFGGGDPVAPVGNAVGVFGQGGAGDSDGVYGIGSGTGYGGRFIAGGAQLYLEPSTTAGHPTGAHRQGELYVDSNGSLYYCKKSGSPGTWVELA